MFDFDGAGALQDSGPIFGVGRILEPRQLIVKIRNVPLASDISNGMSL